MKHAAPINSNHSAGWWMSLCGHLVRWNQIAYPWLATCPECLDRFHALDNGVVEA